MKRLLLIILVFTVLTAGLPLTGTAAGSVYVCRSDGSGGVIIKSCGKTAKGSLTVPAAIDGKTVTGIDAGAFAGCYYVTGVTLPAKAKSVSANAFTDCPGLTAIAVNSGNTVYASKSGVLFSKSMNTLVRCPEGKKSSYEIPAGVSVIGAYAFKNCTEITALTIPSGVKTVSEYAFTALGIKTVSLPASLSSVAVSAFNGCFTLKSVIVNNKNTVYFASGGVLYSKQKVLVRCPEGKTGSHNIVSGVKTIGAFAFLNCADITAVGIPDSVTGISDSAFNGAGITSVTIPSGVTSISASAFKNCFSLKAFAVSGANTAYSANDGMLYSKNKKVFVRCPGGKAGSYTVLSGVTKIGQSAFNSCVFMTKITLPNSVTTIAEYAFYCSGLKSFAVPSGVTAISANAFMDCFGLVSFSVDKNNTKFTASGGVLFSKDKKKLIAYPIGKTSSSYTIPDGTGSVGALAFCDALSLTKITIPGTVSSVGAMAFKGTGYYYNDSAWTNGVLYIGKYLIDAVKASLGAYTIKDGTVCVADKAFADKTTLYSLTIPASVKYIGTSAFYGCTALKKVTVPDTVVSIGARAFGYRSKSGDDVLTEGFVITCKKNSAAHQYAVSNKIAYIL